MAMAEAEDAAVAAAAVAATRTQLRAETRCKLPDCCVLLAAQEHEAAVASFDLDLLDAAEKLGLSYSTR